MPTHNEAFKARLARLELENERMNRHAPMLPPPRLELHSSDMPDCEPGMLVRVSSDDGYPSRRTRLALWGQRALIVLAFGIVGYIWAIVLAAFLGIVLSGCGGRVEEEPNTTVVQEVVQWRAPPGWCCDRDMRDGSSSFECGRNTINWLPGDELISDQECWCNGTMKGPVCQ